MAEEPNSNRYRAICIQHGHYCGYASSWRPEGRLTEYNLVWDAQQGELISNSTEKTRVIGLPYQARAAAPSDCLLRVMFVGRGSDCYHAHSIHLFQKIAEVIRATFQKVEILYRPHPNEFNDAEKIADFTLVFGGIDRTPKNELLNGPRTLFVGEVSSLLYEAKQAGHLTAFVPVSPNNIPTGYHDMTIDPENLDAFVQALGLVKADAGLQSPDNSALGDPLIRFVSAAKVFGIIDEDGWND